jgi:glucokinase
VNDFAANGFGVLTLEPHEYEQLGPQCEPVPGAPIAVVGAGTGLGETYVTHSGGMWEAWPTEGGHANFSPRNQKELLLLQFLLDKFKGRVSTERVVSGKGIVNVFEFLAHENPRGVNTALAEKIKIDEEGAGLISQACHDEPMCKEAIETVMALYGCEVGNTVVKWLPFGGLYIAGGIAMKNMDFIRGEDSPFMAAYKDRGRMSHLLNKVPLRFVNIDDLGLRGAHYVAFRKRLSDAGFSPRKLSTDQEYLEHTMAAEQEAHEQDDIHLTSAVLEVRDAVRAGTFAVGALTTAVLLLAFANVARKV